MVVREIKVQLLFRDEGKFCRTVEESFYCRLLSGVPPAGPKDARLQFLLGSDGVYVTMMVDLEVATMSRIHDSILVRYENYPRPHCKLLYLMHIISQLLNTCRLARPQLDGT